LVTCVGGRLIYDILRGLRSASDFEAYIIGIDADPDAHGRLLCDEFYTVPMAEDDPEDYLAHLISIFEHTTYTILIPLSEAETRIVAKNKQQFLSFGITPSVSDHDTVECLTDKLTMLQVVHNAGLTGSDHCPIDAREDFNDAVQALGYPDRSVVVKPRRGRGSRGVLIVDDTKKEFQKLLPNRFCGTGDLDSVLGAAAIEDENFNNYIAVPYYDGPVYDLDCIAKSGKSVDLVARLRQLRNPLWPTSTGHRVNQNKQVLNLAYELCQLFKIDGAADFDIILADTGPHVIDAGARFSGSVGGSITAGANFPAQLVRVLAGLSYKPLAPRDGVVIRPFLTMAEIPQSNEHDYL